MRTPQEILDTGCAWVTEAELEMLVNGLNRARLLAKNLFTMIDKETWRASGADDGQGHYEGDYHAEKVEEEIRSWQ